MDFSNVYYLMHRNDIVAGLTMNTASGVIEKVTEGWRNELTPPGGRLSVDMLRKWWNRRAVPIGQGNMKRILLDQGICSTQEYMLKNCGLSLTDHYWIKPVESDLTWERVNLFTNPFRDEIAEMQFSDVTDEKGLYIGTTFYPSATTQGELLKKWIILNGKRCLVKGNFGSSCQQSLNEIAATKLHEKQKKVPYTEYRECEVKTGFGTGIGCICENFASEDVEFISAYDVCSSDKKPNNESEYEHFIRVCVLNGLSEKNVREFLEYQILTDFLLTNTDRHFNNFGILRDTHTLKYIGPAPVFDSGNCMFFRQPNLPLQDDLLDISITSFRKKERDVLEYVTEPCRVDMNRILTTDELREIYARSEDLAPVMEGIITGYEKKKILLEKFQAGEKW